jgi:hypothetical protein
VCALRDDFIAKLRLNCNWANTKEIRDTVVQSLQLLET